MAEEQKPLKSPVAQAIVHWLRMKTKKLKRQASLSLKSSRSAGFDDPAHRSWPTLGTKALSHDDMSERDLQMKFKNTKSSVSSSSNSSCMERIVVPTLSLSAMTEFQESDSTDAAPEPKFNNRTALATVFFFAD
eukprot:c22214_g1_i1.p1 GENE.c22214_g1_i1~~c22214_g1_i1.p1  ORF type:complete len:151 (+),score=31.88 c22214_g1_i1:53-454(+)